MRLPALLGRMLGKSTEGTYRGPALAFSSWGNPFPVSFGDGYQDGLTLATTQYGARAIPIAFACVMLNAKALALCPASHQTLVGDTWKKSTTSPASRLLRYPNLYQTWAQFILNAIALMLFDGEAFVLIVRDERGAPNGFHLMPRGGCSPYVEPTEGAVYYSIGDNPMLPQGIQALAPARDVMHLRQYCPRHPLIGETALKAAMLALGVNVALSTNQAAFFKQMSRPSGILSTDTILTRAQMADLRAAFEEQAVGLNAGKLPILGGGLKFNSLALTSEDSQMIEAQRMSIEEVARVMGVPLALVGDSQAGGVSSTEALVNFWLAMGLGSLIENIESSLERAFDFGINDRVEFDVTALLRTDLKTRLDALTKGVQGGIYTPNEARKAENQPPIDGGDVLYLQRQMTPASLLDDLAQAELANKLNPPAPAPANPPAPADPAANPAPKQIDGKKAAERVRELIRRKCA